MSPGSDCGVSEATAAKKERPISFSGPMIRAILAGAKTQTRRVVNPQPPPSEAILNLSGYEYALIDSADGKFRVAGPVCTVHGWMLGAYHKSKNPDFGLTWTCPYGRPGDRLWARETWYCDRSAAEPLGIEDVFYAADGIPTVNGEGCEVELRPAIFMPRWASRVTLQVADVRAERLQSISEDDAKAEGFGSIDDFKYLWQSLNDERQGCAWKDDPMVWVVSFSVVDIAIRRG